MIIKDISTRWVGQQRRMGVKRVYFDKPLLEKIMYLIRKKDPFYMPITSRRPSLKDKQRRMNCFTKKLRNTHLPLLRITLKSFLDLMLVAAFFYFFTDPPWEIPIFHKPSV